MDSVDAALSIGEVSFAVRAAATLAKKKNDPRALRRIAEIEAAHADDEDLPSLARAAKAWSKVTASKDANAADHERLAWAELLAGRTTKAKAALERAIELGGDEETITSAAVAWAERRKDAKRRAALDDVVTKTFAKKNVSEVDVARLEGTVRLLIQAHADATTLTEVLVERRSSRAVWDPERARATLLLTAAHRVIGERARAEKIEAQWAAACEKALPDEDDVRRHVLDTLPSAKSPAIVLERARRRVARAIAVFGGDSPALEMPLYALGHAAKAVEAHEVVVDAYRKLVPLMSSRKGQEELRERHGLLTDMRRSLTALRRFDEAMAVADQADVLKARMALHLHPDHIARAEIYEAMGDYDRMLAAHAANVAQYEAGPPPIYGPGSSNLEHARAQERFAKERAARAQRKR